MAIIGSLVSGFVALSWPMRLLSLYAIIGSALSMASFSAKLTMVTAAIALFWNAFTPEQDYNLGDLLLNGGVAYGALKVM